MNYLRRTILFLAILLPVVPFQGIGQNQSKKDHTNTEILIAAREIITAAPTGALITLDAEGRPRVRAMDPFPPEPDFTFWFGTNSQSRKVEQIKADPRVTLYYLDQNESGYVMIHGKAELINAKKEKEKWWKDEWKAFYPNWPEGYLLIKVIPDWMEVISNSRGIFGDSVTWAPEIQVLGKTGENSK